MPKAEVDTVTGEITEYEPLSVEDIVAALTDPSVELRVPEQTPEEAAAEIVRSILTGDENAPPPWVVSGKNTLGMPFEVRRVVWRQSDIVNEDEAGNERRGNYISAEAVLADGSPAVINCGAPAFKAVLVRAMMAGCKQDGPASFTLTTPRKLCIKPSDKKTRRGYFPLNVEHVTDAEWSSSKADFEKANRERAEKVAKAGGPKF